MDIGLIELAREFVKTLRKEKKEPSPFDSEAVVSRVENGTAWVRIPGRNADTPVDMTMNVKPGDKVQVRIGGSRGWITGNNTAPPTDDRIANDAKTVAKKAAAKGLEAAALAEEALKGARENANALVAALIRINEDLEDLQNQIDRNITSWFYEVDPGMSVPPVTLDPDHPDSTGWDTQEKKEAHIGDVYYNANSGYAWRWQYVNNAFEWSRIADTEVARALADAAKAQDTADHKRRVFVTTPVPPYDVGDLWAAGSAGDLKRCNVARTKNESYQASDWGLAMKYTDDTAANAAQGTADAALTAANGKNKVFHQTYTPTTAQGPFRTGDTWFDTDDSYKMYTYNGSSWVAEQFGNAAIADLSITNGKIANATIQSAKIQSLDAGKITSGYIDAARIQAESLSINKVSGLQNAIDAAGQTASEYIEADSSGIKVAKNVGDASTYTYIDADSFDVYKDDACVASFGDSVRLGDTSGNKLNIELRNKASMANAGLFFNRGTSEGFSIVPTNNSFTSGEMLSSDGSKQSEVNVTPDGAYIETFKYPSAVTENYDYHSEIYMQSRTKPYICLENVTVVQPGPSRVVKSSRLIMDEDVLTIDASNVSIDDNGVMDVGDITLGGKEMFKTFTAKGTATVSGSSGNSGVACTGTVPTGYTPVAVQEITTNHMIIGSINGFSLRSNGATVGVRNSGSGSRSFTITAKILCINTNMSVA